MAEALALAKINPELAGWLEIHCAAQEALRTKFRQIAPPAGLKEQIISEHSASMRTISKRPTVQFALVGLFLFLVATLAFFCFPRRAPVPENTLAFYQHDMVSHVLRGYPMDLTTNDATPIHAYLAQNHAPADFTLPPALRKTSLAGCAVEEWQGAKVSLVCFHTGKPLPPGVASDLWLFVVDRASVKDAPSTAVPQFANIKGLTTATWADGDKLYLLGIEGGQPDIKQYLPLNDGRNQTDLNKS